MAKGKDWTGVGIFVSLAALVSAFNNESETEISTPSPSPASPLPPSAPSPFVGPPLPPAAPTSPSQSTKPLLYKAKVTRDIKSSFAAGILTLQKLESTGGSSWSIVGDVGNWQVMTGRQPYYGTYIRGVPEKPDDPLPIYDGDTSSYMYVLMGNHPLRQVDIRSIDAFAKNYREQTGKHVSTFPALPVWNAKLFMLYKPASGEEMMPGTYDLTIYPRSYRETAQRYSLKWPLVPYCLSIVPSNENQANTIASQINGALLHNHVQKPPRPLVITFNE